MKRALLSLGLVLMAVGCQDSPNGSTVPSDLFMSESKPVGDPGADAYRPEGTQPLLNIPAEPQPRSDRPPHLVRPK